MVICLRLVVSVLGRMVLMWLRCGSCVVIVMVACGFVVGVWFLYLKMLPVAVLRIVGSVIVMITVVLLCVVWLAILIPWL